MGPSAHSTVVERSAVSDRLRNTDVVWRRDDGWWTEEVFAISAGAGVGAARAGAVGAGGRPAGRGGPVRGGPVGQGGRHEDADRTGRWDGQPDLGGAVGAR